MKKFTTIILAVLLMMLMAVPAFAEEAADAEVTTAEAPETTEDTAGETPAEEIPAAEPTYFAFADGHISGSYESDGLVNIYLNDELAGGSTLNIPISTEEEGTYTVKVYVNGSLVHTETVQAGAQEPIVEPGTEEPGTDEPGTEEPGTDEPGQDQPTPGDDQKEDPKPTTKPDDTKTNTNTNTNSGTKKATNVPKTGDAENMGMFMVLGLGAAMTLVAAKRIKSR